MYSTLSKFYLSEKYSLYEVKVSASTSIGEGKNASNEFRTDEDSELYFTYVLSVKENCELWRSQPDNLYPLCNV